MLNYFSSAESLGIPVCNNNGAGLVTFSADRGHHFTGDLTEQLDHEERGHVELG